MNTTPGHSGSEVRLFFCFFFLNEWMNAKMKNGMPITMCAYIECPLVDKSTELIEVIMTFFTTRT